MEGFTGLDDHSDRGMLCHSSKAVGEIFVARGEVVGVVAVKMVDAENFQLDNLEG